MKTLSRVILAMLVIAFIYGCTKNNDTPGNNENNGNNENPELTETKGRLAIQLTDAPFPSELVSEANVTINKIEIRRVDDTTGNPFVILSEEEMAFNLLELTNGLTDTLVDMEIDAGSYDLIRLYVADANIVLVDSTIFDLKVPGGAQTGIKVFINPSIEVTSDTVTELLLDFDVSQSFVVQGNPNTPAGINGFIFKPTIKASNLATSGILSGVVTDSLNAGIDGAIVNVYAADTLNTSALTNEEGAYSVLGLSEGLYSVAVEYGEYQPVAVDDVEISVGNETTVDVQLTE